MHIQFWASTDVGRARDHNEDNFLVDKRLRLFVVCDGMGGHAAGEIASAMSVRIVRECVSEQRDLLEYVDANPEDIQARQQLMGLLERAVQSASTRIFEAASEDDGKHGMGTTCSALLLVNKRGFIAHVGDSRIYLLRHGGLHQMTEDHSLYNEMVRIGKIKPGDPVNLPNPNAVTRAVGVREIVDVDVMEFDLLPHDRFLLCSDGLSGYFGENEQIISMMEGDDLKEITERNIQFALEAGGKDNITAIVVDIEAEDEEQLRSQQVEQTLEILSGSPLFQYLDYKELMRVFNLTHTTEAAPDEVVFARGGECVDLFVVIDGAVVSEGGEAERFTQGAVINEVGFVDAQAPEVTARAAAPTKLLVLPRKRFLELLRREPTLAVKLLWNLLQSFASDVRGLTQFLHSSTASSISDALDGLSSPMSDPEENLAAAGELTPPSGNLVFEEDARALAQNSGIEDEESLSEPTVPPVDGPSSGPASKDKIIVGAPDDDLQGLAEATEAPADAEHSVAQGDGAFDDVIADELDRAFASSEKTRDIEPLHIGDESSADAAASTPPPAPSSESTEERKPGPTRTPPPLPSIPRVSESSSGGAISGSSSTISGSSSTSDEDAPAEDLAADSDATGAEGKDASTPVRAAILKKTGVGKAAKKKRAPHRQRDEDAGAAGPIPQDSARREELVSTVQLDADAIENSLRERDRHQSAQTSSTGNSSD